MSTRSRLTSPLSFPSGSVDPSIPVAFGDEERRHKEYRIGIGEERAGEGGVRGAAGEISELSRRDSSDDVAPAPISRHFHKLNLISGGPGARPHMAVTSGITIIKSRVRPD